MATVFKLGKAPATVKKTVTFICMDGSEASLPLEFKYRTRKQFAKMADELLEEFKELGRLKIEEIKASAKAAAEAAKKLADEGEGAEPADPFASLGANPSEEILQGLEQQVDYIMKAVDGWGLPDTPFNRETVTQLCDEEPTAPLAIIAAYRTLCQQGHQGN